MHPTPLTVILGPHTELHPGAHGSLRTDPPAPVSFYLRGARHHFILRDEQPTADPLDPWRRPQLGEVLDFGPGPQIVHSVRWPVLRRRAWIADLDDSGYPLFLGRFAYAAEHGDSGRPVWTSERIRAARERALFMLAAYAHPSCHAVLMWTEYQRRLTRAWCEQFDLGVLGELFLAKAVVIPPAQRAISRSLVDQKWRYRTELRVLFVGRDFEGKAGRLALRVMQRLKERFPDVRCLYAGEVPEQERATAPSVELLGRMDRRGLLAQLRDAHLLFHPSPAESFGMVFAEAAANGLAIVARQGIGTGHLEELLCGSSCLVDAPDDGAASEEQFLHALSTLVAEPELGQELAQSAYAFAVDGHLSIAQRNAALAELYRRAAEASGPSLSLEDLPLPSSSRTQHATSTEVMDLEVRALAGRDRSRLTFNIDMPEPWRITASLSDPEPGNSSLTIHPTLEALRARSSARI